MIQQNSFIFFIKNKFPKVKEIPDDEKVFGIPSYVIYDAMEFCAMEKLDYCFVGYKRGHWSFDADPLGMTKFIKVTEEGFHPETKVRYLYVSKKITVPTPE